MIAPQEKQLPRRDFLDAFKMALFLIENRHYIYQVQEHDGCLLKEMMSFCHQKNAGLSIQ